MSKGLGKLQIKVLEAIAQEVEERKDRAKELPHLWAEREINRVALYHIKLRLFGRDGEGVIQVRGRGEVKIQSRLRCTASQAANLNRALGALATRGLIVERRESDRYKKVYGVRWFSLTGDGLSE